MSRRVSSIAVFHLYHALSSSSLFHPSPSFILSAFLLVSILTQLLSPHSSPLLPNSRPFSSLLRFVFPLSPLSPPTRPITLPTPSLSLFPPSSPSSQTQCECIPSCSSSCVKGELKWSLLFRPEYARKQTLPQYSGLSITLYIVFNTCHLAQTQYITLPVW